MVRRFFSPLGVIAILWLLIIGCDSFLNPEDESTVPEQAAIVLNTDIIEGPANAATLIYNSSPTFKWKGSVYPGYVAGFQWTLDMDGEAYEQSEDWTMQMTQTFSNLLEGDYLFTVWARDDKDSVEATPDSVSFAIGAADATAPEIRFTQSPTDNSYRAPGSNIFFVWTASDESPFGSVSGYSYRLSGTGASATAWTAWSLNTTSAVFEDLQTGDYVFQVKARDNSGLECAPYEINVTVKAPTILVVDNYIPGDSPFLNEIATDEIIGSVLRDWSWEEWDVDINGLPTAADLAGYSSVIWYVDGDPMAFFYYGDNTIDNPLDDFLDGGGNLWLMGSEILFYTEYVDTAAFDTGHFLRDYLHLTGGGDAGDDAFSGLTSIDVDGFTEIGIPGLATGTGWPDALVPDDDPNTVAIYDLGGYDSGTTAGVMYDGPDFKTVFWSVNFAFLATNHNHLSLSPGDLYPVANHILGTIFEE
ncbi:MAG: hypothetical protein ABIA75_06230 [Candidatus Neomarinimicrobiota bacterium]